MNTLATFAPAAAATQVPVPSADRAARFRRFSQWLEENGAYFPGTRLHVQDGMRELRAAKPLQEGELAIFIPTHLMITGEMAWNSDIGRRLRALRLPGPTFVAAFLLDARRREGFFKPYIDILPQDMSHMPMYMSDSELACLQGSAVLAKIRQEIEKTGAEYDALAGHLPPDMLFSEREYMWAKGIARSRLLNVHFMTDAAMVPLADMMNHALDENVEWGGESKRGFVCTAARAIGPGQTLTLSYGPTRGNGALFVYYGFTIEDNPNDETEIRLPLLNGEAPGQASGNATIAGNTCVHTPIASHADERTRALLRHLRLLQENAAGASGERPISRANELAALAMLENACRQRLSEFGALDSAACAPAETASPRLRDALRVRDGEIRVLHYLLALAATGIAFLRGESGGGGFEAYIEELRPVV